ncbi:MAG: hypothetical protein PHP22_07995 [Oscillospiraceae bacterium]|nr:hypothetical protein [Oscillospiraceae bacterium]
MNVLMTFFTAIEMIAAVTVFLALILWIAIKIEDRQNEKKRREAQRMEALKKPNAFDHDIDQYRANVLGTQIRQPGSEPDYSGSFQDR